MTSPTRAAKFYASVLGWESEAAAAADDASIKALPSSLAGTESVHMFKKGSLHGCFLKVQGTATGSGDATKGKPGVQGTVATFSVESIEDTLAKVEAGGGKVVVYVFCLLMPPVLIFPPSPLIPLLFSPSCHVRGSRDVTPSLNRC